MYPSFIFKAQLLVFLCQSVSCDLSIINFYHGVQLHSHITNLQDFQLFVSCVEKFILHISFKGALRNEDLSWYLWGITVNHCHEACEEFRRIISEFVTHFQIPVIGDGDFLMPVDEEDIEMGEDEGIGMAEEFELSGDEINEPIEITDLVEDETSDGEVEFLAGYPASLSLSLWDGSD